MKNVAFSNDLEPFEFKNFPRSLAPIIVGAAGDTKLSAFWSTCFSKPPLLITSLFFSYNQKAEILSTTSLLECCNLLTDLMNIEHSKNFEKKTSLNFRKTFQCNDFHNNFELTSRTNEAENRLSNVELLINENMYDVAITIWVMEKSSTFQCDSFVRGHHVYMNIWESLVGECLKSRKEPTNEMDKTAVAVIPINSFSEEVVVGHVPKNISKIVFMFLSLPHCALDIFVTAKRINRGGGYGL